MKLWLVMGGGSEIKPGCEWSWVMAANLWLVMGSCGWSWVVAQFSNARNNHVSHGYI